MLHHKTKVIYRLKAISCRIFHMQVELQRFIKLIVHFVIMQLRLLLEKFIPNSKALFIR